MKRTVCLHGELAKKFGDKFTVDVRCAAEAVRALCVNLKGFESHLRDSEGVAYQVILDGEEASETKELYYPVSQSIHFFPVITGAGGGRLKIFIGVGLIAAGLAMSYFSGGTASPWGSLL